MEICLAPVAIVKNSRKTPIDDNWGSIVSEIELEPHVPTEAFNNITDFSHLEIIYYLDMVNDDDIVFAGRPRGNPAFPFIGIFSQRKKDRPNKLGLCTVELVKHSGRKLIVRLLDAIDGTRVLDIKPVYREFKPSSEVRQPEWVRDMMKDYWK